MTARQQWHHEGLIAQHGLCAPELSRSDWVIFRGGWGSCENPPRTKEQGEKKDSRLRALEKFLLMGPHAGPVSELSMAFHVCWQEASRYP